VLQDELSVSGNAITDSWGGRGHYAQNCDVWIKTVNPITLPAGSNPLLYFDSHLYTEWDFDPVTVEVSPDGEAWNELWLSSGRQDWWQRIYVDLAEYEGESVYLRFRLRDQSIADELTDPGWTIDNIRVVTGSATSNSDLIETAPVRAALYPNFPNPFNPETTIRYSLAYPDEVSLEIFNLRGQKVRGFQQGVLPAGNHSLVFNGLDDNGSALASGVYFFRLKAGAFSQSRKMILMK
jgi:hypothetical protein